MALDAEAEGFQQSYTAYEDEDRLTTATGERARREEATEDGDVDSEDEELLVAPGGGGGGGKGSRQRSSSGLRKRLIKLKAGFHADKRAVADAFIETNKNKPHYMKEEYSNDLLVRTRLRLLRVVDSLPIRLLGLAMLLADVLFIVVDVIVRDSEERRELADVIFQVLDLFFSAYFCIEVSLRIIGLGSFYFRRWFELLDLLFIVLSTVITVVYILLPNVRADDNSQVIFGAIRLLIIGRIVRVFYWSRVVREHKGITRFFRKKVSQNKRRYIDEHFDLDLTYVTDRVIAMSFPSSGSEALYRNSIRDVGEFLDKNHFGHYRVYNLCSEREYDTSYFHNQVQRVLIDDHNVPKFADLVDFCEDVFTWMEANEDNVIVVHCKGGKGRTGTMISSWLVRAGLFMGAGESLAYFSNRRTDKRRGSKSQGVQTPSQHRYVLYYERLLTLMGGVLPPPTSLRLKKITFIGLHKVGKGDLSDWQFEVLHDGERVFEFSFQDQERQHIEVRQDTISNSFEMLFSEQEPVVLTDDIKFKFYCSSRSIPTGNDKCQFYFWFNTTFVENNRMSLDRSELDNLQKSRAQRFYPSDFAVELEFEPAHTPPATVLTPGHTTEQHRTENQPSS